MPEIYQHSDWQYSLLLQSSCFFAIFDTGTGNETNLFLHIAFTGLQYQPSDRSMEIPVNQVWDLYTELHVIKVDSFRLKRFI